jgi:hypothetical protein
MHSNNIFRVMLSDVSKNKKNENNRITESYISTSMAPSGKLCFATKISSDNFTDTSQGF